MHQYDKRSVNGDAGEHFFAYTVARLFGWPCRLLDVDIGVDAEIEVMECDIGFNCEGDVIECDIRSTGDIFKAQVKAFDGEKGDTISIYVTERHIEYWKRFCVPLIVCAVDLRIQKVYWKQITSLEAYNSDGKSMVVKFSRNSDELTKDSKNELIRLVAPPESKRIGSLFGELDAILRALPGSNSGFMDENHLAQSEKDCDIAEEHTRKLESLIAHFPWRVNNKDVERLRRMRLRIESVRNHIGHAHNDMVEGM